MDNLIKENLDSFKYQNQNSTGNAETVNAELKVIGDNNGEISLKENNRNELGGQEETQVIKTKKKCC